MKKIYLLGFALLIVIAPHKADAVMQTLNGLGGQNQTFVNDTNFTITSGGAAHTLGWNGLLAPSRGGLGIDASGFATGAIPFFNGSVFGESANFNWDDVADILSINGINIWQEEGTQSQNIDMSDGFGLQIRGGPPLTTTSQGSRLELRSGAGGLTSGSGGEISLTAGSANGDGFTGGWINISAGNGYGTAIGGVLSLFGGDHGQFYGGSIELNGGTTSTHGSVDIYGDVIRLFNRSLGGSASLDISTVTADRTVAFPNASGTFVLLEVENIFSNPVNKFISGTDSTVHIGADGIPGCIAMGDSDGSGITYITANDGVLSASSTPPANCN